MTLPCGHATTHTASIGCCAACGLLFSSDTAFNKHRRHFDCLTPDAAGLVARASRTAPGEIIYGLPGSWKPETTAGSSPDPGGALPATAGPSSPSAQEAGTLLGGAGTPGGAS